jgi:hypothetical protein
MQVLKPLTFQNSQLISTTAVNADAAYNAATTYALGAIVSYQGNRYESLQNTNLNKTPDVSPTWWLNLGATNQFAMFDQFVSTSTTATTSLTVVYAPGAVFNSIALINVEAAVINITIRDGISGPIVYENSAGLSGANLTSWYDYFFLDPLLKRTQVVFSGLPQYVNAHITIQLTNSEGEEVSVGTVVAGDLATLGKTQYGASAGIVDYSIKETDDFGNTSFLKRAFSKRLNCQFYLENSQLNRVHSYISSIRATPAVWVATDNPQFEEALIVYGFFKEFSLDIAYPANSLYSIEIEGLT